MSRKTVGFAIAAATAVLVAGSGAALASTTGTAAKATDYVMRSAENRPLSPTGGAVTTVKSVTLPAGDWIVDATASAVNFGPSDFVRCGIYYNGAHLNENTSVVGDNSSGSWGAGAQVATINTKATLRSNGSYTVKLACTHDHDTGASFDPPYIDAGATLWAHRSSNLVTG